MTSDTRDDSFPATVRTLKLKRPAPRTLIAVILAIVLCAVQAYPFLSGILLTADEVAWHAVALGGFDSVLSMLDWFARSAADQGRIGHVINHVGNLVGAALHEYVAARVVFVGAWFATMGLFAWYVTRLTLGTGGIGLFLVLAALLSLDYAHLPPSSYPLRLTPALFGLLALRLYIHRCCLEHAGPAPLSRLLLVTPLMWLFVLWEEHTTAFAVALVVFTYSALALRNGDGFAGLIRIARRHRTLLLFEAVWLAVPLVIYVVFRIVIGRGYQGAEIGGSLPDALLTLFLHVVGSFGLHRHWFVDPGTAVTFIPFAILVAAGSITAILCAGPWPRTTGTEGRMAAVCVALAVLVTLPVAMTAKYQSWCVYDGACVYVDSRLSFLWLVAALYLVCHAIAARLRPGARRAFAVIVCVALAIGAIGNNIRNRSAALHMDERAEAWVRARMMACAEPAAWPSLDDAALLAAIDPENRISMYDGYDRAGFWRLYMSNAITTGHCGE